MSCQAKADGASCNCDPACGLVTLADAIDARIRLALTAERERMAVCFERLAEKAYEETHFDMYTEFHRVADELRGPRD